MISVHSPHGCPPDFFICNTDHTVRIVIDPQPSYFMIDVHNDRQIFDKMILIQGMEPKEISNTSDLAIKYNNFFDLILTSCPNVLQNCKNAELFLYASCWILTREDKSRANHRSEYFNIFSTDKDFSLSFVMSQKNWLPGHKLRHESIDIIRKKRSYDLFFPQSIPMDEKYKLFEKSMFHIAIENTKNVNYISEKIVDCFMSYTLPIYWGCPNIADYFNTDGIIFFNDKEELSYILDNLTADDYYSRLNAINENYNIANQKYAFHADRSNAAIDRITKQ